MSSAHAFFITGTDTEVGKTTIACGLLQAAKKHNLTTAAIKPLASGCTETTEGLRNDDALALWKNCSLSLSYSEINPFAFKPAIAPHIAAKEANIDLSVARLLPAVNAVLNKKANFTVVEGAGGWRVPLNNTEYLSDLAKSINIPVILVVGVRLGGVNHALLSMEAIKQDGLTIAGWVANIIDPHLSHLEENLQTLQSHLNRPCLGRIPYLDSPDTESIACYLNITPLLQENNHEPK